MNEIPLELEFYPHLSDTQLIAAVQRIKTNQSHWDPPFFSDVYKYANLAEFFPLLQPMIEDPNIKNIIVLGTGGSFQSMDALKFFAKKNLFFLTSSRPHELAEVLSITSPQDSVVIPISRGGNTLDVNSIIGLFREYKLVALSSQGPMYELVEQLQAITIPVPDLSGRFAASVCSVVIVPALLAGMDMSAFQKGLDAGYQVFMDLDHLHPNLALRYAAFLDQLSQKGYGNIFSMPYSQWVEGLVGLFVQEISESSGKEGKGLLGTFQAAPLCQHSVLEFILGGKKGGNSPLLWTTQEEPTDVLLPSFEPYVQNQTGLSIINYQLDATFQALIEQGIPAAKLSIQIPTLYSYGVTIAFIQSCVYFYCLLLDVNWSSNPKVNIGKKICNEALQASKSSHDRIQARDAIATKVFHDFFSKGD